MKHNDKLILVNNLSRDFTMIMDSKSRFYGKYWIGVSNIDILVPIVTPTYPTEEEVLDRVIRSMRRMLKNECGVK